MTVAELMKYETWLKVESPAKIHAAVRDVGGWKVVFPSRVPVWASKVRNYFNVLPQMLIRLPEKNARALLNRTINLPFLVECHEVQVANRTFRDYKPKPWGYDPPPFKEPAGCPTKASHDIVHMGIREAIALKSSLTGDVYLDENNRAWYQMAAGSTIYHFGENPTDPTAQAIYQDTILGQNDTPVFKLVCPDQAGGSEEVIIFNEIVNDDLFDNRSKVLGKVGERIFIRSLTETDPAYQGSYNYSETTRVGLSAHELRDVKSHVPGRFFYVNPKDPYSRLDSRCFPVLDLDQKPLANQH